MPSAPDQPAGGIGEEGGDIGEIATAEFAVDEPMVEGQGKRRHPPRLDALLVPDPHNPRLARDRPEREDRRPRPG